MSMCVRLCVCTCTDVYMYACALMLACVCVCVCVFVCVYVCMRDAATGRLEIVSLLRVPLSLQHVGNRGALPGYKPLVCTDKTTWRAKINYLQADPCTPRLAGASPALNVTIHEAIHFIAYSVDAPQRIGPIIFSFASLFYSKTQQENMKYYTDVFPCLSGFFLPAIELINWSS